MKNVFLSTFIVLISLNVVAQTAYQPLVFQSPEVSFLTNEVKTPVSLSSGTIAIEVPLYTIKEGDITVPISLAYDGSGVKVNSQPTWVGQNWSLKAGGMISRIVKGVPDETYAEVETFLRIGGDNHFIEEYPVGVCYNIEKLQNANWNSTSQIESWAKNTDVELEPDEFVFNFCGHTGRFYMNQQGEFVTLDKKYSISGLVYNNIPMYDARVSINPNDPASYTYYKSNMIPGYADGFVRWRVSRIMGFCITDDAGIKYYFGSYYKDESSGQIDLYTEQYKEIEITADFFSQFFEEEFSTWHLERVVSPQGNTVEFKYEIGYPTVSFSSGYSMNRMSGSADDSGLGWIFGGKVSASNYFAGDNMSGKFVRPVHLSEIRTTNESILLARSVANTLKYDYDLVNYHLSLAQRFYDRNIYIPYYFARRPILRYDDYGTPYLKADLLQTSKLDKISIKSLISGQAAKEYAFDYEDGRYVRLRLLSVTERSGNKSLPPTTFTYNARRLPAFFAEQYDHWGYYNGKTVVASDYATPQYDQKREPNPLYANAEILEKITYPLGGSKTIVYEPNQYDGVVVRNTTTGALSISSNSVKIGGGLRVKQIIESDGTNNYSTTYTYLPGILNGENKYYWGNYQGKLFNGNTYSAERFMTSSLLPVSNNSEGGSVSYSNVTESRAGNGRTAYTFTNHNDWLDENSVSIDLQKSPYTPLSSRVIGRSKLLKSITYEEGGTSPIKKETYQYSILANNADFIPSVQLRRFILFGGYEVNAVEGAAYKIYTYPYNVTKMTEYIYSDSDNDNGSINEHSWSYDSHNQTSSYTMRNSDDSHKVTYKYPYDYSTAPYSSMVEKNMISPVIEETTTVNNVKTEQVKVDYTNNSQISNGLILPASITSSYGDLYTTHIFNKYDSKGHLLQTTDPGGIPTCYIWGYGGDHVVAEIKNATLAQIKSKQGLSNIERTPLTSGLEDYQDNMLRDIPNASVVTYKYKPLVGVTEVKDASGRKIRYGYDDFGRLQSTTDDKGRKIQEFEYNIKH